MAEAHELGVLQRVTLYLSAGSLERGVSYEKLPATSRAEVGAGRVAEEELSNVRAELAGYIPEPVYGLRGVRAPGTHTALAHGEKIQCLHRPARRLHGAGILCGSGRPC
jgi:hypothetical protein